MSSKKKSAPSSSAKAELVAHLDARSLALLDGLEDFVAAFAGWQLNDELRAALGLALDVQVLNLHVEPSRQRPVAFAILEVEDGALGRVVQLVEGLRLVEVVALVVVDSACGFHHLIVVQLPRVRQVLQPVLASVLVTAQDHDVILARLDRKLNVLVVDKSRIDHFKTFESRPHRLRQLVLRIVLSVDESVPAVEALDVGDPNDISAVVWRVLKIVLFVFLRRHCFRGMLKCLLEVLDALGVLNLVQVDRFRRVDVDEDFPVHLVVQHCLVPQRVDHHHVFASLQLRVVMEQREREPAAEPSVDEFTGLGHQDDVEVARKEHLVRVFLSVIG